MMKSKNPLHSTTHPTPVGELTLVASEHGLRAILWPTPSLQRAGITPRPRRNPDHPHRRCFPGTVRAEEAERLTALDVEVDRVDRDQLREALGQATGMDKRVC